MPESLKDTLRGMSQFIKVEIGETFQGFYRGFKVVPNSFDADKEAIELWFEIDGRDKSMTSMGLAGVLQDFKEGDYVKVKKVSKKGNNVVWDVTKLEAPAVPEEKKIDLKDIPF